MEAPHLAARADAMVTASALVRPWRVSHSSVAARADAMITASALVRPCSAAQFRAAGADANTNMQFSSLGSMLASVDL